MRPIWASVNHNALHHNLAVAKRHARGTRLWAVIKANAYGHGLLRCARSLDQADGLALLELESAVSVRDAGIRSPLLMMHGFFDPAEVPEFARLGLTPVVHHAEQLRMLELAHAAAPMGVYLKLNTGMNRLGFQPAAMPEAIRRLRACRNVGDITLMTHFADADDGRGIGEQLARFSAAAVPTGLPRCLANSAALIRYPESRGDWARPGIMLYGCSPFPDQSAAELGLEPVMTLRSRVVAIQQVASGDRIGYGGTYVAAVPMRVGIVACGYADGYPRHAPGSNGVGTPVLVNGCRTRTLGRVSMDMLYVDLGPVPGAEVGAEVTLWGEGLSADEVAAAAGTVSYELLCALAARVPIRDVS